MDFKDGPLQSNLAFLQHCTAVTQQVQVKKEYGQILWMRKMKCSTTSMDGKGLICMSIVGGQKRREKYVGTIVNSRCLGQREDV